MRYCGWNPGPAFAESCNADFVPLGPKIGNTDLVKTAETLRLQLPHPLRAGIVVKSTRRDRRSQNGLGTNSTLESARIGQGEVLAARWRWRASRRRSPTTAYREPTSDRRRTRGCAQGQAGSGDVAPDRRRADQPHDRGGQGWNRNGGGDTAGPGRWQDPEPPSSAPSPASRVPPTRCSKRTPGSRPSSPPRSRSWRSGCSCQCRAAGGEVAAPAAAQVLSAGPCEGRRPLPGAFALTAGG